MFIYIKILSFIILILGKVQCVKIKWFNYKYDSTKLDERNKNITLLDGIEFYPNLLEVNLDHNLIKNLEKLQYLKNLTYLSLNVNKVYDLEPLRNLSNLSVLYLNYNSISSIEPITFLNELEILSLKSNLIQFLPNSLRNLKQISSLSLANNFIRDINVIGSLLNLNEIFLSYNNISDIKCLTNLTKLQSIYINNNQIESIDMLYNMKNLIWIKISSNRIQNFNLNKLITNNQDIFALEASKNILNTHYLTIEGNKSKLEILNLDEMNLKQVKFNNLKYLRELNLSMNHINKIEFDAYNVLEVLDLSYNDLSDIAGLVQLNFLEKLDLSFNKIKNIDSLQYLAQKLRHLDVSSNFLNDSNANSVLGKMISLEKLKIFDNQFENVDFINNLPLLEYFDASNNSIKKIHLQSESFQKLDTIVINNNKINILEIIDEHNVLSSNNLSNISQSSLYEIIYELNFSYNNISSFDKLKYMTNLKYLYARNNSLNNTDWIQNMTSLYNLNLAFNQIRTINHATTVFNLNLTNNLITNIELLSNSKNLREFDISNNLIESLSNKLINNLTNLVSIDISNNHKMMNSKSAIEPLYVFSKNLRKIFIDVNQLNMGKISNMENKQIIKYSKNMASYYKSLYLITKDNFDYLDCNLTFKYLKKNVILNLFYQKQIDLFISKCLRLSLD